MTKTTKYKPESDVEISIEVNGEMEKIMDSAEKIQEEIKKSDAFKKALLETVRLKEEDQIYIIHFSKGDDSKVNVARINHNFSAFELLGVIDMLKSEILNQINGAIKAETSVVKRYVTKMEDEK